MNDKGNWSESWIWIWIPGLSFFHFVPFILNIGQIETVRKIRNLMQQVPELDCSFCCTMKLNNSATILCPTNIRTKIPICLTHNPVWDVKAKLKYMKILVKIFEFRKIRKTVVLRYNQAHFFATFWVQKERKKHIKEWISSCRVKSQAILQLSISSMSWKDFMPQFHSFCPLLPTPSQGGKASNSVKK